MSAYNPLHAAWAAALVLSAYAFVTLSPRCDRPPPVPVHRCWPEKMNGRGWQPSGRVIEDYATNTCRLTVCWLEDT